MRRTLVLISALSVLLAFSVTEAAAADWELDPTYGDAGILRITSLPDSTFHSVQARGGRIISSGEVYQGKNSDILVAVSSKVGVLDSSFSGDGIATRGGEGGDIAGTDMTVAGDGTITVVVTYEKWLGIYQWTADGARNPGLSGDGKRLLRLDKMPRSFAWPKVATDSQGRIIVALRVGPGRDSDVMVYRLRPNGQLDNTFSGNGMRKIDDGKRDYLGSVTTDSQDRVLIGTFHGDWGSEAGSVATVRRWTPKGRDDDSFSDNGRVSLDLGPGTSAWPDPIEVRSSGITVAMSSEEVTYGVARLNDAGRLVRSYGDQGIFSVNCRCQMWASSVRGGEAAFIGIRLKDFTQVLSRVNGAGTGVVIGEYDIQPRTQFDFMNDVLIHGEETLVAGNAFSDDPLIARLQ